MKAFWKLIVFTALVGLSSVGQAGAQNGEVPQPLPPPSGATQPAPLPQPQGTIPPPPAFGSAPSQEQAATGRRGRRGRRPRRHRLHLLHRGQS